MDELESELSVQNDSFLQDKDFEMWTELPSNRLMAFIL